MMSFLPRKRDLISSETGTIIKKEALTEVSLVFPNSYRVGMSNLGFQTLYGLINSREDALCHRAFLDREGETRTVETGRRLSGYDIVAFSIPFELDYLNAVRILGRSGISFPGKDRAEKEPLIIAGGAAVSLNPEPLSPFIDAFVAGEAEELIGEILDLYAARRRLHRTRLLEYLSSIPGVYVPSLYEFDYGSGFTAPASLPLPVRLRRSGSFLSEGTRSVIVSPGAAFSNMFLIEVSRGCSRGCLFCPCPAVYGAARHRGVEAILGDVREGLGVTGRIGFVGAAVSDYPEIDNLVGLSCDMGGRVSTSSLRADSMTAGLLSALRRSGQRTITLAPETGSYRLRRKIGKPISDGEVLSALEKARKAGFRGAKLYFMIGLPGETTGDVEAIVRLLKKASAIIPVRATVAPFVPKAWTPFSWSPMESKEKLKAKGGLIRKGVSGEKRIKVVLESSRTAVAEAALARGDRLLGHHLARGTADEKLFRDYAGRSFTPDDHTPWEIIDPGFSKEELWKRWMDY